MKRFLVLGLVFMGLAMNIFASDEARILAEGNKAYEEKDFGKAIKIYEGLQASGFQAAELEYNLGNAWYKSGSIGRAVLHFERALIICPNDAKTEQNLKFLRTKISPELEPLPPFFLAEWWRNAKLAISSTSMGILGLIVWWLGFGALATWQLGKSHPQKKWGLIAGIALLALSFLPFSLALGRMMLENDSGEAVLIQKSAILRAAPAETSQELMTLQEGIKFQQLENQNGWWQVRLENGEIGWLPEQAMERI